MSPRSPTWLLPGPAAFVGRICTAAYEDRVVALHAPVDAAALADAAEDRLHADGLLGVVRLDLLEEIGLCSALQEAVGARTASPAGLAACGELDRRAVVATTGGGSPDPDAAAFARFIARSTSLDGPRLLWVARTVQAFLAGFEAQPVRGAFDALDGLAYAAALPRRSRPLEGRLALSIAVEVAGWDVVLLDRLATLPFEKGLRPDRCVSAWDDGRMARWQGRPADWAEGSLDDWEGQPLAHPAWMAGNDLAALSKRVWRGQLAVLMPWIERHRLSIIERHRPRLRPDVERSGMDVEMLDWGPLIAQMTVFRPALAQTLHAFRIVRNELAHGRPIEWTHLRPCLFESVLPA